MGSASGGPGIAADSRLYHRWSVLTQGRLRDSGRKPARVHQPHTSQAATGAPMHNTTITHLVSVSYESDSPLCDYDSTAVATALQQALDNQMDVLAPSDLAIQAYSVEVNPQLEASQPPVTVGQAVPPALGAQLVAVLESVQEVLRSDDPAIADTICVWNTSEPLVVPVEAALAAYQAHAALCQQPASSQSEGHGSDSGWQVMPVSATRKMIDAAQRVEEDGYDAMYQAMRAAAPKPPTAAPALFVSKQSLDDAEQIGMHATRTANAVQDTPLFTCESDAREAAGNEQSDYWGDDHNHPVSDWMYEVQNGDTRSGYWQWVESRKEQARI